MIICINKFISCILIAVFYQAIVLWNVTMFNKNNYAMWRNKQEYVFGINKNNSTI